MKRTSILVFTVLAVLLVSSLAWATPAITIDGLKDDWAEFEPVAYDATRNTQLSAFISDGFLYVMVAGPMGEFNDIQIDSDLDASTGHQTWIWPNMGSDWLLENGELFASAGADWAWELITAIDYATTGEGADQVIEMSLDLELIGLTDEDPIRIGFAGGGIHAPAQGFSPVVIKKQAQ